MLKWWTKRTSFIEFSVRDHKRNFISTFEEMRKSLVETYKQDLADTQENNAVSYDENAHLSGVDGERACLAINFKDCKRNNYTSKDFLFVSPFLTQ